MGDRISAGESLRKICEADHLPSMRTALDWLAGENYPEFRAKYARARETQGDVMDDRILQVAEGALAGTIDPHAAKVAIGAFQWRASKLKPKVYGDTQRLEHSGPGGGKLEVVVRSVLDAPPKP